MNQADFGQAEIEQAIGLSQPTISKGLRRNKGKRGYRHKQVGKLAKARQQQKKTHNNHQRSERKRPRPNIP
jgi:IS30 family transposase